MRGLRGPCIGTPLCRKASVSLGQHRKFQSGIQSLYRLCIIRILCEDKTCALLQFFVQKKSMISNVHRSFSQLVNKYLTLIFIGCCIMRDPYSKALRLKKARPFCGMYLKRSWIRCRKNSLAGLVYFFIVHVPVLEKLISWTNDFFQT